MEQLEPKQKNFTPTPTHTLIQQFENHLSVHEQLPIKTTHYFSDKVYSREIFIPKGTILTGKIHKTEHLNIISKGKIIVVTELGRQEICAPFTLVSPPNTKRVGYAVEDTVWTTIHNNPDNIRDLEKLESILIVPEKLIKTGDKECLG